MAFSYLRESCTKAGQKLKMVNVTCSWMNDGQDGSRYVPTYHSTQKHQRNRGKNSWIKKSLGEAKESKNRVSSWILPWKCLDGWRLISRGYLHLLHILGTTRSRREERWGKTNQIKSKSINTKEIHGDEQRLMYCYLRLRVLQPLHLEDKRAHHSSQLFSNPNPRTHEP